MSRPLISCSGSAMARGDADGNFLAVLDQRHRLVQTSGASSEFGE
ncbi:MAG: hypothetical protein R3F11_17735 [Verrucomicrobiales bacterium]